MRPASPGGTKVKFHDEGPGDRLRTVESEERHKGAKTPTTSGWR